MMASEAASTNARRGASLVSEAARQMTRLLAVLALLDVLIHRAAEGALGLQLSLDHPILRAWCSFGDLCADWPQDALLMGSLLAVAMSQPILWRRKDLLAWSLGAGSSVLALQALLHRISPQNADPPAGLLVGLGLLAALALGWQMRTSLQQRMLALAVCGLAACSVWMSASILEWPRPLLEALEGAGETMLLVALAGAHMFAGKGGLRGWLLMAATSSFVGALFLAWPAAALHATRHLFHLGQAGLSPALLGTLLALALGSLARLASIDSRSRSVALLLALMLMAARGPQIELITLRVALVALVATHPWRLARVPDGARGGG